MLCIYYFIFIKYLWLTYFNHIFIKNSIKLTKIDSDVIGEDRCQCDMG